MQFGCGLFLLIVVIGGLGQFLWNIHPIVLFVAIAALLFGLWKWYQQKREAEAAEAARESYAKRLAYAKSWQTGSGTLARDTDRDLAVELLRAGHEDGRLPADEMADRMGAAMSARTHGDLAEALNGLLG
ncbi:DUF1707 domain-containing protein [Nonomuraea sp. NPDC050556]|uniref:DUF1707 domain-containing protein n=1 Tax=Nonomuraea sp. NPDC050556 TaxID=3364369 RepID=UPI00378A198F